LKSSETAHINIYVLTPFLENYACCKIFRDVEHQLRIQPINPPAAASGTEVYHTIETNTVESDSESSVSDPTVYENATYPSNAICEQFN
jgi:hypothetical protein